MTGTPFQDPRSEDHMFRSKWTELVMSAWCSLRTLVGRSINRRKKIRPGLTTLQAKDNDPMRDKSSDLMHFFCTTQEPSKFEKWESLSGGSLIEEQTESISIPRKVMHWDGPRRSLKCFVSDGDPHASENLQDSVHLGLEILKRKYTNKEVV